VLSLHKMAPVARTICWGQWDERACTWTSWSANIVETKTAVPLQVSHIYRSLFQIMAQKAPECFSYFYMQYLQSFKITSWVILTELQDCDLQSFKITILGHTYRASRLWLPELQNHNLGSYLQSFKIVTYRASKSQSWVTLPIESTVAIPVMYAMFFFGQFCDVAKVAIIQRTI
jgi:hypothetical protein